jgi:AcrR family transcriptional regulator
VKPRSEPRRPPNVEGYARAGRTRALVIDETIACVVDEGFAAASARHIAERAGVTWGVIQYHFGDRAGLLMAVVDQGLTHLLQALELPANGKGGSVRQRAEALVEAAWSAFSSPTSLAALEILICTRCDRDARAQTHLIAIAEGLARLARQAVDGMDASKDSRLGELIWATLQGLVVARLVDAQAPNTDSERSALVDLIVRAMESAPQVQ